jgi:tryptophanyl-tRNA synthetase
MKILSGIRPSGRLHLGNFIGSILPAMKYDAEVLIAEYHSIDGDAEDLIAQLSPFFPASRIKRQSEHFNAKLYFNLLSLSPDGLLRHMPQYKSQGKTADMFVYPVLMAHDLVGYDRVIVGEDQRPHIEFARDILHKINEVCPEPIYEGGKVMDLRDPTRKMSKSLPESCFFLGDEPNKIMKAVTTPAGRKNLEFIADALNVEYPYGDNKSLKEAIIEKLP